MRKQLAISAKLLWITVALAGCSEPSTVRTYDNLGLNGKVVVERTATSIPLTDDDDYVSFLKGNSSTRLLTGQGAKSIDVAYLGESGLIVIAYCHGRLGNVRSSILDSDDPDTGKLVRVQVITEGGFSYKGQSWCNDRP